MAIRIPVTLQDIRGTERRVNRAEAKGWMSVRIPQPVDWPEVNTFLDSLPGEYLTISRPVERPPPSHPDPQAVLLYGITYEQYFWFSNEDAAFSFKMKYG